MNSLLKILNPKKSSALTVKAKRGNGFFLEAVDDDSSAPSSDHTGEAAPQPAAIALVDAAAATPTAVGDSAIVVAAPSTIAPATPEAKPGRVKKFRGKAAPIVSGEDSTQESNVIDAVATVVATAPEPEPTTTTFAPTYLSPALSQTPRRRPGPSLSGFMDMAQQLSSK
jgi:hypothetical protein